MSAILKISCRQHPKYRGILEPKVQDDKCACWSLWRLVNMIHPPGLDVERIGGATKEEE